MGDWVCTVCKTPYKYFSSIQEDKGEHLCQKCNDYRPITYKEVIFSHPTLKINCGIDFIVDVGENKLKIVELKSIKAPSFNVLSKPLAEHKLRTNLYLNVIHDCNDHKSKRIDTEESIILYVCKGYGISDNEAIQSGIDDIPFTPFKEFRIKRELNEDIINIYKNAEHIDISLNGGELPPKICEGKLCKRAQKCAVVNECFSIKG